MVKSLVDGIGKVIPGTLNYVAKLHSDAKLRAGERKAARPITARVARPELFAAEFAQAHEGFIKLIQEGKFEVPAPHSGEFMRKFNRAIANGDIAPEFATKMTSELQRLTGLTMDKILPLTNVSLSEAARSMAYASMEARALRNLALKHPDFKRTLTAMGVPSPTAWDMVSFYTMRATNLWRAALVSQFKTAARNAQNQYARSWIDALDDILAGSAEYAFSRVGAKLSEKIKPVPFDVSIAKATEHLKLLHQSIVSSKTRQQTLADLSKIMGRFPYEQQKLFRYGSADIAGIRKPWEMKGAPWDEKASAGLTVFSNIQEAFFRRTKFLAESRAMLRESGFKPWEYEKLTSEQAAKAVDSALDSTYANVPKSDIGRSILAVGNKMPFVLFHPFVRFALNSLKFAYNTSPLPLMNPKTLGPALQAMKEGNTRPFAQLTSRAMVGTAMIGGFYALRENYAGARWYEFKDPDSGDVYDMRAWLGPFIPFLFAAESRRNPQLTFDPSLPWLQAFASMNRMYGSGLLVMDIMFNPGRILPQDFEDKKAEAANILKAFAGKTVGGFTVPLRMTKDIVAFYDEAERIPRTTMFNPLIGPTMGNIPFLSRRLPPAPSLTKPIAEPINVEVSFFSGVNIKPEDKIYETVVRLQSVGAFNIGSWIPGKTGNRTMDYLNRKHFAEWIDDRRIGLEADLETGENNEELQVLMLREMGRDARKYAREKTAFILGISERSAMSRAERKGAAIEREEDFQKAIKTLLEEQP